MPSVARFGFSSSDVRFCFLLLFVTFGCFSLPVVALSGSSLLLISAISESRLESAFSIALELEISTIVFKGTNLRFFERRNFSAVMRGRSFGMVSTSHCCLYFKSLQLFGKVSGELCSREDNFMTNRNTATYQYNKK